MKEKEALRTRNQIPKQDKWKVEKIYGSREEWERDFTELKRRTARFSEFQGKLNQADKLLEFFRLDESVFRLGSKLYVYAHLRSDEDTANTEFLALKDRIGAYLSTADAACAYAVPELLSYPEGTVEEELKSLPALEPYRFALEKIMRAKPHTLDRQSEEVLASLSDCLEAPGYAYTLLTNADLTFPPIHNEDGEPVELAESNYIRYLTSKDRAVRKEAFQTLFQTYGKYRNTLSSLLISSVKRNVTESKLRHYRSALEGSLFPNEIPAEVYHRAIETIHANLRSLHRYVEIKKKFLHLDDIHMYDLYVPLIDVPKERIPFEDAVAMVQEGLAPLGEEYLSLFRKGIESGWVDRYPNKGKRSGAYSSGCYDTDPYVLLNYNYSLDDVSTLAHEMGHSIHSYYSKKTQPYIYADYTLFCAEVASTTNEALLLHHRIAQETDPHRRLYLINSQLEQIRTTVFRQMMFAEFELFTHEKTEQGIPLTADDLSARWHELNAEYYGPQMTVDPEIDLEWARIPHFYRDFYVYQYATGYAAANSFATRIRKEGKDAVKQYTGFLKSGGSDYPIQILRKAGVDMTTPKPMQDTMDTFSGLLDLLEKTL